MTPIRDMVRYYTRESRRAQPRARGGQDLPQGGEGNRAGRSGGGESEAKAGKKAAAKVQWSTAGTWTKYLGVRRFDFGRAEEQNEIGLVTGLAWTEVGGDLLQIEATAGPRQGRADP